ncbi:MAG: hypothetical protein NVS3B24_17950 [Candidatus Dormibacteria bacterium]
MKTAISLPDDVFEKAERLADRLKVSRSALYRDAISQYLLRHEPDELTTAMNRAVDAAGEETDPFREQAAAAVLRRVDW